MLHVCSQKIVSYKIKRQQFTIIKTHTCTCTALANDIQKVAMLQNCSVFVLNFQVERTLANNRKPKGKPQYYLPILNNLDDVEPGLEPDPNVYCDIPTCTRRDLSTVIRQASFHCFHQSCLSSHDCCPICLVSLKKKVQKLANTFNTGLLTAKDTDTFENNEDIHEEEMY